MFELNNLTIYNFKNLIFDCVKSLKNVIIPILNTKMHASPAWCITLYPYDKENDPNNLIQSISGRNI